MLQLEDEDSGRTGASTAGCGVFPSSPDGGGAFAQVVAELQDPLVEGQRDEVAPAVGLLAVVEDHPVGVVGHEGDGHADLLPSGREDDSVSRRDKGLSQSKGREGGTLPEVVAVEVQPLQLHVGVAVEERHVSSSPLNHCKGGRKEDTRFILRCSIVTALKSRIFTLYL